MVDFEVPSRYTGPEAEKAPGALADEYLLSRVSLEKATAFFKDTYLAKATWEVQLQTTFGISKDDLYAADCCASSLGEVRLVSDRLLLGKGDLILLL